MLLRQLAVGTVLFILSVFTVNLSYAQLQPVGPNDANQAATGLWDMAISTSSSGSIFTTFKDYSGTSIRKYNGASWQYVGQQCFTPFEVYSTVVNSSDEPYVTIFNGTAVQVIKFDGTNWSVLKTFSAYAQYATLAIDGSDDVYIAYQSTISDITIEKYNGTTWSTIGTIASTTFSSIKVDGSNNPYILYNLTTGGTLAKYNGTSFVPITSPTYGGSPVNFNGFYIDLANNIYVSGNTYTSLGWYVYKYNGTSWSTAGNNITPGEVQSIAFDATNTPYLILNDNGQYGVKKLISGNWSTIFTPTLPIPGFPLSSYDASSLINDNTGNIYFSLSGLNYAKAQVQSITGTTFTQVGETGHSQAFNSICIDKTGNVYLSHADSTAKIVSGSWQHFGGKTGGFEAGGSMLAMDTVNGILYTGHTPNNIIGGILTVKKWVSGTWISLPALSLPTPTPGYGYMGIRTDRYGSLYFLYSHSSNGTFIKKYNGTTWVDFSINFLPAGAYACDFIFDNHDKVYLAWKEAGTGYTGNVSVFNGVMWTPYSISSTYAEDMKLAIGVNDTAYVCYTDYISTPTALYNINVQKLAGSGWVQVGLPRFSPNTCDQPAIAVSNYGDIFVSFRNDDNYKRHGLMRFDGTDWLDVSGGSASEGIGWTPRLAVYDTTLYFGYGQRAAFLKKYSLQLNILLHPLNANVISGANTSFTVYAPNANTYKWQVNDGTGWVDLTNNAVYSNVSKSTLNIASATGAMDAYQYRCIVANNRQTAISNAALLNVCTAAPPTVNITVSPSASIAIGDTFTFKAIVANGGTNPQFQWLRDGRVAIGATSDTYKTNLLNSGEIISVKVKSSNPCAIPDTAISNAIIVMVSVSDVNTSVSGISIYPNPVTNLVNISLGGYKGNVTTEIVDITGKKLLSQHKKDTADYTVPVSNLNSGVYFIKLTSEGKTIATAQIIKQ